MKALEERFWEKVDKTEGCWEWTASRSRRGYGQISFRGKPLLAHRVSYEMANGEIPEGLVIDHMCHNAACVNPSHMQAVSQRLNSENRNASNHSKSGVRGVSWNKNAKKYEARAGKDGKIYYAGIHATITEAEVAAVALRNRLFTNNLLDRVA